jgi:dihydroflavonol-4-reductase
MPKTLITGASGFVGSHLARALAERGDDLRMLVRSSTRAAHLDDLEFERVNGDITDRRAVRRAVAGVDRVFHVASMNSINSRFADQVMATNVGGTKLLCDEALAAGVGRVIHCSSAAALGPADPNGRADETQQFPVFARGIPWVHSKHESEAEALRAAAHGLEVVIVNPSYPLGPGSPGGTPMRLVRKFLLGEIPAFVDGGINVVDVRDVAAGMLAADETGDAGERYILAGRNFTQQRLFADFSRISGVPAPPLKVPADFAIAASQITERIGMPLPVSPEEARVGSLWWTYTAAKAKRELGFKSRAHEETLQEAIAWQLDELGPRVAERTPGLTERALHATAAVGRAVGRLMP